MTRSASVPAALAASCRRSPEGAAWLATLPERVGEAARRWGLTLSAPFAGEASCAWVAPATRADGSDVVLKVGLPHMEAEHEALGLAFWDGDPTVRLLESDATLGALLLERCRPGTPLAGLAEAEQDTVLAGLLRRLWRVPPPAHGFRPLSAMLAHWAAEARAREGGWPDPGLVEEGLRLFEEPPAHPPPAVLLATDLHAGNVVRARRAPWLVIDPKPFVGDRAYDATQHLLNCPARVRADPLGTIGRFADLLEVDPERVRLWLFARVAAAPPDEWRPGGWWDVALAIAP